MPATIDREPLSLPQTNLQLYNQLLCAGYPEAEIERVHAAYTVGEFGDGQPGSSDARRQQVRRAVGAEAEELVTRYTFRLGTTEPSSDCEACSPRSLPMTAP